MFGLMRISLFPSFKQTSWHACWEVLRKLIKTVRDNERRIKLPPSAINFSVKAWTALGTSASCKDFTNPLNKTCLSYSNQLNVSCIGSSRFLSGFCAVFNFLVKIYFPIRRKLTTALKILQTSSLLLQLGFESEVLQQLLIAYLRMVCGGLWISIDNNDWEQQSKHQQWASAVLPWWPI